MANAAPPPTPATTTERPEIRTARVIRRRDTNITNHCNRPVSHSAFKDRRVISDLVISIHAAPNVWHHPSVDTPKIAESLRIRRADLAADLDRLTAPPEAGATVGFGKRIGEGTAEAVERLSTTATARSIAQSLADVDRALAKIADGTYGVCDTCGEAIPEARLAALPATAHCVRCKPAR